MERLDKLLSHEGFGSRKEVKILLRSGAVKVNGEIARDPTLKVDENDVEIFAGEKQVAIRKFVYLMMNKPRGCVSANKDGLHATVFSFLSDEYKTPFFQERLHIVGRLDIDTEGLLVFTTDGALIHRATSPKSHLPKTYRARLKNPVGENAREEYARRFAEGIHIAREGNEPEADCAAAKIEFARGEGESVRECLLTIYEGKYHQVKRMFAALGNEVASLSRVSIGSLALDKSLRPGEFRELSENEVESLEK